MAIIIPGIGGGATTALTQTITETVKNVSIGTLLKGTPVRITGSTGQECEVLAADASTSFPANFVLAENLAPGGSGQAVALGFVNNISVPDASAFTAGQEVYLAVGGGWATARPTGTANVQLLGNIVKVNTGNNTISGIFAPQNIEYLPNLAQGKTWVGNSSGIPEESDPVFNGQIITGPAGEQTQLFFQTATPTAEVANALWLNTTTNVQGFWNGTYWLGGRYDFKSISSNVSNSSYGDTSDRSFPFFKRGSASEVFVEKVRADMHCATVNGSNYWNYSTSAIGLTSTGAIYHHAFAAINSQPLVSSGLTVFQASNVLYSSTDYTPITFLHSVQKVGSPTNLNVITSYTIREILA